MTLEEALVFFFLKLSHYANHGFFTTRSRGRRHFDRHFFQRDPRKIYKSNEYASAARTSGPFVSGQIAGRKGGLKSASSVSAVPRAIKPRAIFTTQARGEGNLPSKAVHAALNTYRNSYKIFSLKFNRSVRIDLEIPGRATKFPLWCPTKFPPRSPFVFVNKKKKKKLFALEELNDYISKSCEISLQFLHVQAYMLHSIYRGRIIYYIGKARNDFQTLFLSLSFRIVIQNVSIFQSTRYWIIPVLIQWLVENLGVQRFEVNR